DSVKGALLEKSRSVVCLVLAQRKASRMPPLRELESCSVRTWAIAAMTVWNACRSVRSRGLSAASTQARKSALYIDRELPALGEPGGIFALWIELARPATLGIGNPCVHPAVGNAATFIQDVASAHAVDR